MASKILVAVEFCKTADELAMRGYGIACTGTAEITFIHVIPEPAEIFNSYSSSLPTLAGINIESIRADAEKQLAACIARTSALFDCPAPRYQAVVEVGNAAHRIVEHAKKGRYDLIVIGHKTRNAFETFFVGSTTDKVVKEAPCSVLVYKARGEK